MWGGDGHGGRCLPENGRGSPTLTLAAGPLQTARPI